MSIIHDIAELLLREGDINAQEQRERYAAEEETRQGKHRLLRNTLKTIAQIAPYFIPGVGPIVGPAVGAGVNAGFREPEFLDPEQYPDILVKHR